MDKVESGAKLVRDAGSAMDEIVSGVQRVSDIIGEITAAAGEQRAGIEQVNGAVSELEQMTQQNAALVEQSAAAAESLREQAHKLASAVAGFKLEGTTRAPAHRRRRRRAHRCTAAPTRPPRHPGAGGACGAPGHCTGWQDPRQTRVGRRRAPQPGTRHQRVEIARPEPACGGADAAQEGRSRRWRRRVGVVLTVALPRAT